MGYNDRYGYRNEQSRQANRLSRESAAGPTITMEKDRSGSYSKIADVAKSAGQLVPLNLGTIDPTKNRKLWRNLFRAASKAHPFLRAVDLALDLFEIYRQWFNPQQTGLGGYTQTCSSPLMSQCINPGVCNQFAYCDGPVFGDGSNNCPSNQAFSYANAHGSAYAAAHAQANTNGFHVVMVRSDKNVPMPCPLRGSVKMSFTKTLIGGGKVLHMPNAVKYRPMDPMPTWARHRWISPELFRPGQPTPDPLPPPYPLIPKRKPSEHYQAGNDTATETVRDEPFAYRAPPSYRTTERKYSSTATARQLEYALVEMSKGLGRLTDARDLLGALDEALPKELQAKGKCKKQIPCLLRNVADNLLEIDGEKALLNIIKELAEDVVGGVGDKYASDAAREFGWFKQKFHLTPRF